MTDSETQRRQKAEQELANVRAVLEMALRDEPGWKDRARSILLAEAQSRTTGLHVFERDRVQNPK
jgi:hypothetical protein